MVSTKIGFKSLTYINKPIDTDLAPNNTQNGNLCNNTQASLFLNALIKAKCAANDINLCG